MNYMYKHKWKTIMGRNRKYSKGSQSINISTTLKGLNLTLDWNMTDIN